jgi:hypothetical protein
MLIDFESSGGYANLQLSFHANTDTLPPDVAAEISKLVASSGVFEIKQEDVAPSPSGPPDVLWYRLSLRDGSRQTTLALNDVTAPASLHPLLALLRQLAVEEKLKRQ